MYINVSLNTIVLGSKKVAADAKLKDRNFNRVKSRRYHGIKIRIY